MKIINTTATIPYPPLIEWAKPTPPEGWAEFPDRFVSTFYPAGKKLAGFVDITVEEGAVTACTWNEDAYQAYIAGLPDPEPAPEPEPTADERISALEAENHLLNQQVEALTDQNDFQEELIVELANIVYA